MNLPQYQNGGVRYVDQGTGALFGTVFQGNQCTNCPSSYTLDTGAIDTTIWNATSTNSPGIVATFLHDFPFATGTKTISIGTIVGND